MTGGTNTAGTNTSGAATGGTNTSGDCHRRGQHRRHRRYGGEAAQGVSAVPGGRDPMARSGRT